MPGIATHHVFGGELHGLLGGLIGASDACRQAFVLGNLGPDPFFFLVAAPTQYRFVRLGPRMHAGEPSGLLDAVHEHLAHPDQPAPVRAYALGFLCHYLLDSAVHPLVYAQQFAIARPGVEGLSFEGQWLHRSVHATIETEIDEYMLTTHLGTNPVDYKPHVEMLRCPPDVLAAVSRQMALALNQVYDLRIPDSLFATAVACNRLGQVLLDSKSSGLRGRFDPLPPAGGPIAYYRALSPSAAPRTHTDFTNDDHLPWPHPYEPGKVMDASFDELYAQTFQRALAVLPAFADPAFDLDDCRALAQGVNFLGRIV